MRLFGLIGYPLSHSFSKKYFTEKFTKERIADAAYELFELQDINAFPQLLASQPQLRGLNVTIPHKVNVIPFLGRVEEAATRIGAVNVIKVLSNGQTIGYNSDYFGFQDSLINWFTQLHGEAGREKLFKLKALILGSGGASKAVRTALDDLGIVNHIVSREAANGLTYDQLDASTMAQYPLVINSTPLGMSPHTEAFPPFPYHLAGPNHYFYDLVYNPVETVFMQKGRAQGAATLNGLPMLHLQAEKSWEIWNS